MDKIKLQLTERNTFEGDDFGVIGEGVFFAWIDETGLLKGTGFNEILNDETTQYQEPIISEIHKLMKKSVLQRSER